jgi:hypothetical protein
VFGEISGSGFTERGEEERSRARHPEGLLGLSASRPLEFLQVETSKVPDEDIPVRSRNPHGWFVSGYDFQSYRNEFKKFLALELAKK